MLFNHLLALPAILNQECPRLKEKPLQHQLNINLRKFLNPRSLN
jgi:hypothetical protein